VIAAAFVPKAAGLSLCEVSEPATNVLALAFIFLCCVGLVYLGIRLWRSYVASPAVPQPPELQESSVCISESDPWVLGLVPDQQTRARYAANRGENQPDSTIPQVIYFTDTAVTRKRSFHTRETCSALSRASRPVCNAALCKLCERGAQ
jgi:hypothetical protein